MILGTNYIKKIDSRISRDDATFWQIVDLDICYCAEKRFEVYIDGNMDYVESKKNEMLARLGNSNDPQKMYLLLINKYAFFRSKRQKKLGDFTENGEVQEEDINFFPEDMKQDHISETGYITTKLDYENADEYFEEPSLDILEDNEEMIQQTVSGFQYLTQLEKGALLNKLIDKEKYPLMLFNEMGIRLIGFRALIKRKLSNT